MSISEEIESRIDIVELVREYVPLKKAGANYKWLSPFKPEKTPSFVVSPAKQIAFCFSTNQGWGPIKILMLIEKLTFREALHILAKKTWLELEVDESREWGDKWPKLYQAYEYATKWYKSRLNLPGNTEKLQYLLKRWLTKETIDTWSIGVSDEPRALLSYLIDKGCDKDLLLNESWLFVSATRDKFFDRVVFPIANYRGDTIAFTGRTLSDEKKIAKYINSPETPIFHKSNVLFGLDKAKMPITQEQKVVVVEWQMDVIALHQADITNVIALSGTAFTEAQIRMIRRLTDQVYLFLDNDSAGIKATFSCIESLANTDMDTYVIPLPNNTKDADEALEKWHDIKALIENALTHIGFMLAQWHTRHDLDTTQGKKKLIDEILTFVTQLKSALEIDMAISEIADKLDISREVIYSAYHQKRTWTRKTQAQFKKKDDKKEVKIAPLSKAILSLLEYMYGLQDFMQFHDMSPFDPEELEQFPEGKRLLIILNNPDTLDESERAKYELIFSERMQDKTEQVIQEEFHKIIHTVLHLFYQKLHQSYAQGDPKKLAELIALGRKSWVDQRQMRMVL